MPTISEFYGIVIRMYFMDHAPVDWHDLAANHDFALDEQMRLEAISRGAYLFPLATKQCSISAAHTSADIDLTLGLAGCKSWADVTKDTLYHPAQR